MDSTDESCLLTESIPWRVATGWWWIKTWPRWGQFTDESQRYRISKTIEVRGNEVTFKQEKPWDIPSSPKSSWLAVGEPDAPTWKLSGTQGTSAFWEPLGAPLPPKKRVCNYVHPKQHSPFPDRLRLPYPDEEILSRYEEDVSFIRDGFTAWLEAEFETILERHAVDFRKALAEFREASARKHHIYFQEYRFDSNVPYRSPVQKRLSI